MAKETFYAFGTLIVETVFEYDTPKYVHIKNKKIGLIYRLVQLAILAYVIGYGIIYQHQAQKFESVQSVVTTKLKGVDVVNEPEAFMVNCPTRPPDQNWIVFDHTDLVVPPQQPSAFFVTTNMWITCGQTYGVCPEDKGVPDAACNTSNDCPADIVFRSGNGVTTGNCSNFNNMSEPGTCLIKAWCPVEDENDTFTQEGPKVDIRNFTVLVKNTVSFPTLEKNFRSRNIAADANKTFLATCTHDDGPGLYCPIFTLGQILDMANNTAEFYHEVTTYGAVIGLQIHWDCNLDLGGGCSLRYEASRLDNPEVRISPGYNFRYSRYYYLGEDSQQYRDEVKAYGILFMVEVTGQGRKFDVVTLVLALGSTIALLAIATVVTDGFAMYIVKRAGYYRTKKYQQVDKELLNSDSGPQQKDDSKINYGSTTIAHSPNEKQPLLLAVQPASGSPP